MKCQVWVWNIKWHSSRRSHWENDWWLLIKDTKEVNYADILRRKAPRQMAQNARSLNWWLFLAFLRNSKEAYIAGKRMMERIISNEVKKHTHTVMKARSCRANLVWWSLVKFRYILKIELSGYIDTVDGIHADGWNMGAERRKRMTPIFLVWVTH